MEEKTLIIRKSLYYIGKFSEKIYEEFIKVKEISEALYIFLLDDKSDKSNKNININMLIDRFFSTSYVFG